MFFNGQEIPTNYLNITNADGFMPTISVYDPPNMFLNAIDATAVKVKLPSNSTVPLKGQYYNLYNQGTQLITILNSDSNAPIANIAGGQQVTVTRNYDNNTWFAIDSNQATLINLAGTDPTYILAQYDKPSLIVNCTGTNAKLFLDDGTHLAGVGKQILIINSGSTNLKVYGTDQVTVLFTLIPNSEITAYYTGSNWKNAPTPPEYLIGTFTPTLNNWTTAGTVTATGTYVKIGQLVYYTIAVTSTGSVSATVQLSTITGLPFAASQSGQLSQILSDLTSQGNARVFASNLYVQTTGVVNSPNFVELSGTIVTAS